MFNLKSRFLLILFYSKNVYLDVRLFFGVVNKIKYFSKNLIISTITGNSIIAP